MKRLGLLLAVILFTAKVHAQTVMSNQGYSPSNARVSYKFWVGKSKAPRRHFVDYPKANHVHLDHVYRHQRTRHMHGSFNKKGSFKKRKRR